MFRVEIGKSLHRLRTWVFATGLAGLAVLPVVVLATSDNTGGGPLFFDRWVRRSCRAKQWPVRRPAGRFVIWWSDRSVGFGSSCRSTWP